MVPDIGGGRTDYFVVKNPRKWGEEFEKWLQTPNWETYFDDESDESDDETIHEEDLEMEKVDNKDKEHDEWLAKIGVVDDESDMDDDSDL